MGHKITVGALRALLGDNMGRLDMPRERRHELGLVPKEFGDEGYTAAARLSNVGLTFDDLKEAGLGIQSESHGVLTTGRMSPNTVRAPAGSDEAAKKSWQAAFRDSYRAQHGGRSITPVCTGSNCPTGIVPYTIPDKARAAQITLWTAQLMQAVEGKADNELVVIPAVGETPGTGALLGTPSGVMPAGTTRQPKAAAAPVGFMAFHSAVTNAKTGLNSALAAAKAADDQSQVVDVIAALEDYISLWPESLSKVSTAAFDDKVIRTGVEVNLIQGTAAFNVATAALKRFGVNVDATTVFTVTGPRMKDGVQKGWEYQPKGHEPLRNPLFAMILEGQPSQLKRVVKAPPVVHTWKAAPGELANFGPDQVIILDVTGETATVYYLDDEVAERQGHELGEEGAFHCTTSALSKPV
jgi:hypothetical protein